MIAERTLHLRMAAAAACLILIGGCKSGSETDSQQPQPGPGADTTAPEVSITDPSDTGSFTTMSGSIVVAGNASDNAAVTQVTWSVNGGAASAAEGLNDWSTPAVQLAVGDNTIRVTAQDAAGNSGAAEIVVTREDTAPGADTTAPEMAITSPSDTGTFTTAADSIVVAGTASDNVAVTEVTWSVDGGGSSAAVGLDDWSTSVIPLAVGDNTIRVSASDAAGNSASDEIVVTHDPTPPAVLNGIAIIGDSNSDEYRADDNRGGSFASVTFNWVEQLVRFRGLNFGAWGTRSSPRRSGYGYNWALSGATADTAIDEGQHTGVAAQVAAGEVSLVYIYVGFNDFAHGNYRDIYNGSTSGSNLDAKIEGVIEDITTAVDVVQAAGPVEIVLVDLYDFSVERPELVASFPDPARRQVVTDAVREVNAALASMAQQRGIVLVEFTPYITEVFASADQNGFIHIAGELIDVNNPGNEPHHFTLDDGSHHGGTIGNALFANEVFIEPVNAAFGAGIMPFTEQEMLEIAGIAP